MPIRIKSIEYTEHGVNIIGDEVEILELADGTTREIHVKGYAAPMGINDFDGDQELARQKIAEHVAKVTGEAAASPIAEVAVLRAEKQQLEAQLNDERITRAKAEQELSTERTARQLAEAQRNEARDQLLQRPQPENDNSPVDRGRSVLEGDI